MTAVSIILLYASRHTKSMFFVKRRHNTVVTLSRETLSFVERCGRQLVALSSLAVNLRFHLYVSMTVTESICILWVKLTLEDFAARCRAM